MKNKEPQQFLFEKINGGDGGEREARLSLAFVIVMRVVVLVDAEVKPSDCNDCGDEWSR